MLAVLLLGAGAWCADRNLVNAQRQSGLLDQAHTAELALSAVLFTLKDAETGQRGYLLTGDLAYLQPYRLARARIGSEFAGLESAPMQNNQGRAACAQLARLSARKFDELSETISLYEAGQTPAALALVRTNLGERLTDQIRIQAAAQQAAILENLGAAQARLPPQVAWGWIALLMSAAFLPLGRILLQQVRAQKFYAASTRRLERFTRAFGMGLGMIRTASGRITVWSEGSERLYGFAAAAAVGRISHELLQTHFPAPLAEINAQLRGDGYWQGELVHRRLDGSELRVFSRWALHGTLDQDEDLVIEVNSDITSAAATDAILRSILETAPALIYAKDLDGRMLLANPPSLTILGKPWEQVQGRTDRELLDNENDAAVIMENDRRVMLRRETEYLDEQAGTQASGAPRIWSSCKAPMFNGSGSVIGMVGVSLEITATRQIEAQLREQATELKRAYADMSDFAHIIAHDLRAPLLAVESLANWIEEEIAPTASPQTLSNLARLAKRIRRMTLLLEGLLSFSQAGHAKAHAEPVEIAALVAEIAEMLEPPPGMTVRYMGENLTIQTPRPPLVHVLQNLISNAIKHHDRREGEITVSARQTDDGAEFSVADDGPGIPPAAHKKIFDIFQTLAVRPATETSGVGLSIVRKTVEAHGGKVSVESNPPARGTTFRLTWPQSAIAEP